MRKFQSFATSWTWVCEHFSIKTISLAVSSMTVCSTVMSNSTTQTISKVEINLVCSLLLADFRTFMDIKWLCETCESFFDNMHYEKSDKAESGEITCSPCDHQILPSFPRVFLWGTEFVPESLYEWCNSIPKIIFLANCILIRIITFGYFG
jgi:hypothetical protein